MKAANEAQNARFNEFECRKKGQNFGECFQQGTYGARTSVECPSAQGSSGARSSVECPTDQRQISELFSNSTSDTRPYGISVEDIRAEECVIPDPENIEDEIRLLCSSNDKDTHQKRKKMQKMHS